MAFGTLLTGNLSADDGTDVKIFVDRDGYSGTTYAVEKVQSDRLIVGQSAGNLFAPTRRSRSETTFIAGGQAVTEAKQISKQPYGSHRVRVEHDGSEVYRGFAVPSETTSTIRQNPRTSFTVRADIQLDGLQGEWRQPGGQEWTGEIPLSEIAANIFSAMGLARPIDAVLTWRPDAMAQSDDPLAIKADAAAWKRENEEGDTQILSRKAVLSDVVGIWLASVTLEDGVWRIRQPTAYRSGSSVTRYEYDSSGSPTGTSTQSTTVDLSGEAWEKDSDEVSGVVQLAEASVTYEHGAPANVSFNGSFEQGSGTGASFWAFPPNRFAATTNITANSDSQRALEIEGIEKLPDTATLDDMRAQAGATADVELGVYVAGSETVDLSLQYRSTVTPGGGIDGDRPELIRMYWAVSHTTIAGAEYWLIDGQGWTKESDLGSLDERLNGLNAGAFGGSAWAKETVTIPSPPASGTLGLELAEPVSRQQSDQGTDYDFRGFWDENELSRSLSEGAAETLFRATDSGITNGDALSRTFRIGDGPYEESPGALVTPSGDPTGSWSAPSRSGTYALHELVAKEAMAALRGGAQLLRVGFRQTKADTLPEQPKARQAVVFDDERSWPVLVRRAKDAGSYRVSLIQLRDEGHPPTIAVIPGGSESFSGGVAGGTSTGGGAGSWSELQGKPDGLLSLNGDTDGIPQTVKGRRQIVQSSEPTDIEDGDIWFKIPDDV